MAHTVTINQKSVMGDLVVVHATVAISSYTTGGEALTPAEFGLVGIENMIVSDGAVAYHIIKSGLKLVSYGAGGTTQTSAEADVGNVFVTVFGRGL